MMRRPVFVDAPVQAQAMLGAVEQRHPGALAQLREDPLAELRTWPDIQVSMVRETRTGSRCSVAGSYQPDAQPPTLVVGMSRSVRRRGFTGLHELGHHLQQTDTALGQNLFARQDSEGLEEAACDAFAARVLLPDDQIAGRLHPRGPTASDVIDLFHRSQASREACCVRAAEYLRGAGAVVLLDSTGTAIFAAPRGLIPPAQGSDQSQTPLITAALRSSATVEHDRTVVAYRAGGTSDALYGQAAWCDEDYLIAVLAPDNVPWRAFAPPRPETRRSRFGAWWTCETCDEDFRVAEPPCDTCGDPRCPNGHCGCTTARAKNDRTCDRCFLTLSPSRFEGASTTCRDCS